MNLKKIIPLSALIAQLVFAFEALPSLSADTPADQATPSSAAKESHSAGWFPSTRLFHVLMADPRRTVFSGSFRYGDTAFDRYKKTPSGERTGIISDERLFGVVSAAGRLPLYRWKLPQGFLQAGCEGGVWALFAFKGMTGNDEMSTMLNADYLLGFPVEYAWKDLAVQFRLYHVSTHVGDELLVEYPDLKRINLSYEAVELFISYYIIPQVRAFFGLGCVVHHAQKGTFEPVYLEYGMEFRPFAQMRAGKGIWWQPYAALYFRNRQYNNWSIAGNYSLGIEFLPEKKLMNTRFQICVEFYHGKSFEGQFYHNKTSFLSLGVSFEL